MLVRRRQALEQTSSQAPISMPLIKSTSSELDPIHQIWKSWKYDHPEFKRDCESKTHYDGKILIVGGYVFEDNQKALNIILMDPETQKFQVIPSVGDAEACCWNEMSACYWRDSQIVVFGGCDNDEEVYASTVAIITLKDLDSENPSAHWEKMVTPTELCRYRHLAHIYDNKMFVIGGTGEDEQRKNEIWCLDLTAFTWSQCSFPSYATKDNNATADLKVFHENKVYILLEGAIVRENTVMGEFNFETMSSRTFTIPAVQPEPNILFEACPQVIDGKIYLLENFNSRSINNPPPRQIWTYDLSSEIWTEIKTESCASLSKVCRFFYTSHHLVLETRVEHGERLFGEFYSLELNPSRTTKTSSTSTNVNKVQQTMKEFFFEAPYSDVCFEVQSETIPAHKWLLAQRSKFFATLFSGDEQPSKIAITDLKAPTFRAFLEYLYSDHVEIDDTIALELLQQANKYLITGELKTACEKHILKNIEPETYVAFGKLAESIGATSLRDAVVLFIARNMKKIKTRKDFNEISDALLRDSIVKFIVK